MADMIFDEDHIPDHEATIIDPLDLTRRKKVSDQTKSKDLLVPIFRKGKLVYDRPDIEQIRQLVKDELDTFHPSIKRFTNPHGYPVGLEHNLYELKNELIMKLRGNA